MGPGVYDLFNGARQWERTYADYAMSMTVLSSTKVRPDIVSQIGINDNNVQPTLAFPQKWVHPNCMSL